MLGTATQIALLDLLLSFTLYMEARSRYTDAKNLKRDLHAKAQRLERRNGPMLRLKAALDAEYKELQAQREKKKGGTKARFRGLEKKVGDNETLVGFLYFFMSCRVVSCRVVSCTNFSSRVVVLTSFLLYIVFLFLFC